MTVKTSDVFIFWKGEAAESAYEKMSKALDTKNEAQAAVNFARTMLDMGGTRKIIEDEGERKRLDLLYAFYKIHAVKNKMQDAISYASELAGKVYGEFTKLGGSFLEDEAYRTGKTIEEIMDRHYSQKPQIFIDTRRATADEEIKTADENENV